MADKKSPGTEDALDKLKTKILEGGGPVAHGATVTDTRSSIVQTRV